jgi:thiamine pyrophosphokinase
MSKQKPALNKSVILFGNGEVPKHKRALEILESSSSYICIDGGADKLKALGFEPTLILGDLDSVSEKHDCKIIRLEDESASDLEKSILWCLDNNVDRISLLGFSGLRDDHNLLALQTLKIYSKDIRLTLYSNFSKIICIKEKMVFKSTPGQTVSIVTSEKGTNLSTHGLKYALKDKKLDHITQGLSNIAIGNRFSVEASKWVWVFQNYTS